MSDVLEQEKIDSTKESEQKLTKPKRTRKKKSQDPIVEVVNKQPEPAPATRTVTFVRNGEVLTKEVPIVAPVTPQTVTAAQSKQLEQLITENENKYLAEKSLEKLHKDWPMRLTAVWILQSLMLAQLKGQAFLPKIHFYRFNYPVVGLALQTLQWKQLITVEQATDNVYLK